MPSLPSIHAQLGGAQSTPLVKRVSVNYGTTPSLLYSNNEVPGHNTDSTSNDNSEQGNLSQDTHVYASNIEVPAPATNPLGREEEEQEEPNAKMEVSSEDATVIPDVSHATYNKFFEVWHENGIMVQGTDFWNESHHFRLNESKIFEKTKYNYDNSISFSDVNFNPRIQEIDNDFHEIDNDFQEIENGFLLNKQIIFKHMVDDLFVIFIKVNGIWKRKKGKLPEIFASFENSLLFEEEPPAQRENPLPRPTYEIEDFKSSDLIPTNQDELENVFVNLKRYASQCYDEEGFELAIDFRNTKLLNKLLQELNEKAFKVERMSANRGSPLYTHFMTELKECKKEIKKRSKGQVTHLLNKLLTLNAFEIDDDDEI